MFRVLFLTASLVATPLFAAELGDSYVKLFQVQVQLAQSGNASALYSLGEMHEQGLGTQVDLDQAYAWYEKAASKGDKRAKYKLASRSSSVSDEQRMKKAITSNDVAKQKAHEEKVKRAVTAKKRARSKALLKKQREMAQADDLEDS